MLHVSLQVLPGISARKEAALWRAGVLTWDDFERKYFPQRSLLEDDPTASSRVATEISACRTALAGGDISFFASRLEKSEHYRIALSIPDDCLFLDIETTGLSRYYDQITVIGWRIAGKHSFQVAGQLDDEFRKAMSSARCVITFNGTLFDIPFIREAHPDIQFPPVHIDLRFLAKRAGLSGGQKAIEKSIGITRSHEVSGVSGEFAPVLWHRYKAGDLSSLRTLLEYNLADIDGMVAIFEHVTRQLINDSGLPAPSNELNCCYVRLRTNVKSGNEVISKHLVPFPINAKKPLRLDDIVFVDRDPKLRVVGIDLTGSSIRASGWCLLDGAEATTARAHTDDELVTMTHRARPHLVSIDSPLTLPEGRIRVDDDDPGRERYGIMRFCERVLKKRGVNVYPALLPSMQRLTARGIALAARFRSLGLPVIESYPGAAQDIMRIPRKQKGLEYLEQGLAAFGVNGDYIKGGVSHDELDAITSAIVGVFFWASMMERLGPDPLGDEALIIPDLKVDALGVRNRLVVGLSGPLGAGKTTTAKYLENLGFYYCRFSTVIERLVAERTPAYTRADLQTEGARVHQQYGQRWLARELLRPIFQKRFLVIDGLRFPDDHAFLTEIFASQFLHIHVSAEREIRRARFAARESATDIFDVQERHMVESGHEQMRTLARDVLSNCTTTAVLFQHLDALLRRNWKI